MSGRRARRRNHKAKATAVPLREHGYVVLCDIAAFSEKTPDDQVKCVRHLDEREGIEAFGDSCAADCFWNVVEDRPREAVLKLVH